MKTIYRYVLKEMFPSFLLCVTLLTFLFMINKVFLSLDLVLNKKVGLTETLLLYLNLLPFILSITIPMGMMVGTLLAFGRLSSDMEVTAFKSGGGHIFHLMAPVLVLGAFMTIIMLYFNDTVLPASKLSAKKITFNMVKKKADVAIRERIFIDQFEDCQFYIDHLNPNGLLAGITMFNHWLSPATLKTVQSKTGDIETNQITYQVYLHLYDGVMSWGNNDFHTYNRLYFERLIVPLKLENQLAPLTEVKKEFEEMNLRELSMAILKETDGGTLNHMRTEYQKRLALPFACIVLTWLCAPIGLWTRSKGFTGYILGIAMIFVYYLMFIFGMNFSNEGKVAPFWGLWGANLILGFAGCVIYYLVVSERSAFKFIRSSLKHKNYFSKTAR